MWAAIFAWGVGSSILNFCERRSWPACPACLPPAPQPAWQPPLARCPPRPRLPSIAHLLSLAHQSPLPSGALVFFLARLEAPKDRIVVSEEAYAQSLRSRSGINLAALGGALAEGSKEPSPRDAKANGTTAANGSAANGSAAPKPALGGLQLVDLEGQQGGGAAVSAAAARGGASALPFKPLCMTFRDVKYSVPFPKVSD